MVKWQLEFPPEIQAEREPILAALDRAMDERTSEAELLQAYPRCAQDLANAWNYVRAHLEEIERQIHENESDEI